MSVRCIYTRIEVYNAEGGEGGGGRGRPADGACDTGGWEPQFALDWYVKLRERMPIYADRFVTNIGDS